MRRGRAALGSALVLVPPGALTMLLVAILLCAAGLALIVYRYDMYEREPWYMLVLALALGAAASWVLGYAEDALLGLLPGGRDSLAVQAAVAGVGEELVKLVIVVLVWVAIPRHFNDPFDGLIYGALAGLGFAVEESVFYMSLSGLQPAWLSIAGQETVRLMLHLLLGGLTCVGLGLARFRVSRWPAVLSGGIAASMLIHFGWDYFCGLPALAGAASLYQRAISIALMLSALVLFAVSVSIAAKHSGDVHRPGRSHTLWGWPFTRFTNRRKVD